MSDQNSCYCCEGLSVQIPVQINNRSGLNAVTYRIGTHPLFKQSLLARLSLADQPALKNFTTREDDDFSIALLDSWSVIADILTFYQERIINESFLGTATERLSVLELARLIGYELRPGVAATSFIAFTLDDSASALGPVLPSNNLTGLLQSLPPITINKGIKIQSIPAPGEKAQIFETVENITARAQWNSIKPRMTQPQDPLVENVLLLKGTNNNLNKGDSILVKDPATGTSLKTIQSFIIDNNAGTTRINLAVATTLPQYKRPVFSFGDLSLILKPVMLTKNVVTNNLVSKTWRESDFNILIKANRWSPKEVYQSVNAQPAIPPAPLNTEVFVFRKRVPVFGYNAPKQIKYNGNAPVQPTQWEEWNRAETPGKIHLDNAYEEILPGTQLVVQNPTNTVNPLIFYEIDNVTTTTRTEYNMSSKTTQVSLNPGNAWWDTSGSQLDTIRSITVFAQSEKLELSELPIEDDVSGDTLTLDRYYPGLFEGQAIVLSGVRTDLQGVTSSEVVVIKEVNIIGGFTDLTFKTSLSYTYIRKTVTINANVAKATHGETVQEVLGNGDAGITFQTFKLKQPPLTFVTADSDSGVQSTLEIRVNDLLWHEVAYFLDHKQDERIYITRQDNYGNTNVIFGDGINGARVPTGQQNIKAIYRKGIGAAGLVKANQLSQLQTKPLGVKSAINLVGASGAQDAEQLDSARSNAGLTILTLDRVVSLQDYEDFARAFAGIEKSLATWTLLNGKRHIFITVAGSDGAEVPFGDNQLGDNLLSAIKKAGDSKVAVKIVSYTSRFFQVSAGLVIGKDYTPIIVLANVEQNLRDTFSFKARRFTQPVTYSEVISCIQQTQGVIAVDLKSLFRSEDPLTNIKDVIGAAIPNILSASNVIGAELLTIDPRPVDLTIIS